MATAPTSPSTTGAAGAAAVTAANPYAGVAMAGLNALSGITTGSTAPTYAAGELSDRSPIHIAPVCVNLGAILQPFNEGSPENGGYGVNTLSRYMPEQLANDFQVAATGTRQTGNYFMYIMGAVAIAVLALSVRKKGV